MVGIKMKASSDTGANVAINTPQLSAGPNLRRRQNSHSKSPTRKYEIVYCDPAGDIVEMSRSAPALPTFENAFGALGRGAMVVTATGPMTVEDLLPGDKIRLASGEYEKQTTSSFTDISARSVSARTTAARASCARSARRAVITNTTTCG